jgi:FtsZ-binding cell division protein ZapB
MADIVEVVHKITYDIDDRALVNITRVLQLQVQELQELNRSFADLQKQIQATATTEKHLLAELSNKADALLKRLEASAFYMQVFLPL